MNKYNPTWILTVDADRQLALGSATLPYKTRGITLEQAENMEIGESKWVLIQAPNYGVQPLTGFVRATLTRTN